MKKINLIFLFALFLVICFCHNLACGHTNLPDLKLGETEHSSSMLKHRLHQQVDICLRHSNLNSSQCVSKQILNDTYSSYTQSNSDSILYLDASFIPTETNTQSINEIHYYNNQIAPRAP